MQTQTFDFGITPRTTLERRILESPDFRESLAYAYPLPGRPEPSVGIHVTRLLEYVDFCFPENHERLRLVAMLHDFGKHRVVRDTTGRIIGPNHADISESYARSLISDEGILRIIKSHDKYYSFYLSHTKRRKFDRDRFVDVYSQIDIPLMTEFNYVDVCERPKTPVIWFEDMCNELGLTSERVYVAHPKVLVNYEDIPKM